MAVKQFMKQLQTIEKSRLVASLRQPFFYESQLSRSGLYLFEGTCKKPIALLNISLQRLDIVNSKKAKNYHSASYYLYRSIKDSVSHCLSAHLANI